MARKTTTKAAPANNGFMDWLSKQVNNIKSYLPDSKTVANVGKQMQSGAKSIANTVGKITPTQAVNTAINYAKANPAKTGLVGGMLTAAYDPLKTYVTDPAIKYIEQGLNSAADTIIDKYGNNNLPATKIPDRPKEVPLMTAEEYANSIKKTESSPGSKSTAPAKGLGKVPQQIKRKESTQQKVQQPMQEQSTMPAGNGLTDDQMEVLVAQSTNPYARNIEPQQAVLPSSRQTMSPDEAMLEFESAKDKAAMQQSWSGNEYNEMPQAELDTQARYNQLASKMPAADKYDYIRNSGIGEDAANAHIENVMKQEKAKVMSGLSKEDQAAFMQYLANK